MSRTDKDRPYWVKVNDEGVETHYHHIGYGNRGRRTFKKVFDDEGNPVMETREVKLTAKRVIETVPRLKAVVYSEESPFWKRWEGFYTETWRPVSYKLANPVYSEAEHLIALGLPNALVTVRVDTVQKVEEIWVEPDLGCDIDDNTDKRNPWGRNCGKELPYWLAGGYSYQWNNDYSSDRRLKRDTLKTMAKAYNSGEDDWEDGFDRHNLTPNNKGRMEWW